MITEMSFLRKKNIIKFTPFCLLAYSREYLTHNNSIYFQQKFYFRETKNHLAMRIFAQNF